MFQETVAKFAADVVAPHVRAMDVAGEMDHSITRGLFANGLLAVEIPAEWGGSEASFTSLCLTIEELSKVDPVVGLLVDLQNTVVNNVFLVRRLRRGEESEREREMGGRQGGWVCLDGVADVVGGAGDVVWCGVV